MTEFCLTVYRWFCRHRTAYWALFVILFLGLGYFATRITLEEDISKMMPAAKNDDGTIKLAFSNLKIKDKVYLLFEGKNGADVDEITATCDAFVDSLFALDAQADTASRSIGDIIYLLDENIFPDAIDYLSQHLPAFVDTAAYKSIDTLLTRDHLLAQMQRNHDDILGEFGSMYPELIGMDPLGLRNLVIGKQTTGNGKQKGGYRMVNQHFFSSDSTLCVALITPNYTATNTGQGSRMFEMINQLSSSFSAEHPDVQITYHGSPASGYYNSHTIKHDLLTTIPIAFAIIIVLFLLCFRRWDVVPLMLIPVLFGTIFGLAMMYFLKGQFSLIALGIGAIVLGVAMSYVLHVVTQYRYTGDVEQTLRDEVKPVLMGCITTIGSFIGLVFVDLELLRDFGLFATFAIVGTTLFSILLLPPLLRGKKEEVRLVNRLSNVHWERNKLLVGALGVVTVVCIAAFVIKGTNFDADMTHLGYQAELTTRSSELLREKTSTGDKTTNFASSGKTMEEALENFSVLSEKLDSLKREGLVKSYTPTNRLFVPKKTQQQRINAWKNYWTNERLTRLRSLIAETAPLADLNPEAFDPFFEMATADYTPDALYEANILPMGMQSLLLEKSLSGDYLCFTSVRSKQDSMNTERSAYLRICDAVSTNPQLMVLDTYYYTTDNLAKLGNDFNVLQWVSMAFVLLVLWLCFHHNARISIITFLPILLSWLIVLGAMNLFKMQFNLVNIIISTFIFGIGVDYSIFIMSGLLNKDNRLLKQHKAAVALSAIILIVSVGSMLFAQHPAIRSVGFATLVGLLSAVLLSYVIIPLLYKGKKTRKDVSM